MKHAQGKDRVESWERQIRFHLIVNDMKIYSTNTLTRTRARVSASRGFLTAARRQSGCSSARGCEAQRRKAHASRANGRLGGRPPKNVTKRGVRTKATR